jgi:phosphoglycolate phosphatase-like HAD superfamily hydrolase
MSARARADPGDPAPIGGAPAPAAGVVADARPVLVTGLDGTLYRSDDPVRFYARRVADWLPRAQAGPFLDAFEHYLVAGVAAADASADQAEADVLHEAQDAWDVVRGLAAKHRIEASRVDAALRATRARMLDAGCRLEVVAGLVDVLAELRGDVRIVLAADGRARELRLLLERLKLTDLFDEVVAGQDRPAGLRGWMALALGGRPAFTLFSLGGRYRSEVAPAVQVGAPTGYVDRFGRADGPATATGTRTEDLLPVLETWAQFQRAGNALI